jgi:YD repeat-containing protein
MAVAAALVCAPGAARAADHAVSFPTGIVAGAYTPATVEAGVGDTVTFSGAFASHPLAWNAGDFAIKGDGTTGVYAFTRPGTFAFHCQIHASMSGSVHVAGNQLATPDFTWAQSGTVVTYTPTGFADPDGTIARYEWDLDGNGSYETFGAAPTKTYAYGGTVDVRLRYVDDGQETSTVTTHAVTIAGPPPPSGGGGGGGAQDPPPSGGDGAGGGGGAGAPSPGTGGGDAAPPIGGGQGGSVAKPPGIRVVSSALAFRRGRAAVSVRLVAAGNVRVTIRRGTTTLATGAASGLRAGTRRMTVKLTKAGTRALRAARGERLRATLSAALQPRAAGGAPETARRTVTLR